MTRLRRFYWQHIRRNPVHTCKDCGTPTNAHIGSYWLAANDLWLIVVGTDKIVLCPACFTARAARCGINVSWEAVSDNLRTIFATPGGIARARASR